MEQEKQTDMSDHNTVEESSGIQMEVKESNSNSSGVKQAVKDEERSVEATERRFSGGDSNDDGVNELGKADAGSEKNSGEAKRVDGAADPSSDGQQQEQQQQEQQQQEQQQQEQQQQEQQQQEQQQQEQQQQEQQQQEQQQQEQQQVQQQQQEQQEEKQQQEQRQEAVAEEKEKVFDFTGIKKKKKKNRDAAATLAALEEVVDGSGEVFKRGPLYTYEELLGRITKLIEDNNPELHGSKRYTIKPPQLARVGSKKVAWTNFREICAIMQRSQDHVFQFVLTELGTEGSIGGDGQLVLKGKFGPKHIESLLKRYITEYVTCSMCKSPKTTLKRDSSSRLHNIYCASCGASRSVTTIKSGFHAVSRADRRRAKNVG